MVPELRLLELSELLLLLLLPLVATAVLLAGDPVLL